MALPLRSDVLDAFQKAMARGSPAAAQHRRTARINEQFVSGIQWAGTRWNNGRGEALNDAWFDDEGVPRIYINECQGLMTTWSALLNKQRRSAVATPASPEVEDAYRAEVANKVIDFFVAENETATKTHQAVEYAFQDGTAGLKITYDLEEQRVRWDPLTIHTYLIDNTPDWRDAKWVIFENHYSEDEVAELYKANNIPGPPPSEEEYANSNGEPLYGVPGAEYWQRPTKKFPQGFYACIIKGEVVELRDYPYVRPTDNPERPEYLLPLALMKVRAVWDSSYGKTPMTDIVPLQRSMNEMVSRAMKLIRTITNVIPVLPKTIADVIDMNTATVIGFDEKHADAARAIGYTQPGQMPPAIAEYRDYFRQAMNEVAGLNDITVGTENRSISGRALEAIYELDAQKNADAAKSLEDMVLSAWRLTLALVQIFYTDARKIKIGGDDGALVMMFNGADIQGVDIRLQSASEVDKLDAARVGAANEALAAGAGTASAVAAAQKTPSYGLSKRLAERLVKQFIAGDDIDVAPDDLDLDVFADVITKAATVALAQGRREDWAALQNLKRLVKDGLEERAAEAAPPEPQQPPAEVQA